MKKLLLALLALASLALAAPSEMGAVKKFSVLGNSISTYKGYIPDNYACYGNYATDGGDPRLASVDHTWWMQVGKMAGMEFLANASWSGSCVSDDDGKPNSAFTNDDRVANLAKDGVSPDVIFVAGGVNDWWRSRITVATFKAQYTVLLNKLKAAYPSAQIVSLSILPNRDQAVLKYGQTMYQFCSAISEVAAECGAIYVDMTNCELKNHLSQATVDGLHPTMDGMKMVARGVVGGLMGKGVIENETAARAWIDAPLVECNDDYYYMCTPQYTNKGATRVHYKSIDGDDYVKYTAMSGDNMLSGSQLTDPHYIFHVKSRGGIGHVTIGNIARKGNVYLKQDVESNAWSKQTYTNGSTSQWSSFVLFDSHKKIAGRYNVRSVGASTQYWRKGGAGNGITTSTLAQYNDEGNDIKFEPIAAELKPWAKYVEAVNNAYSLTEGTTPGHVVDAAGLKEYLDGLNLTYNSSTNYASLLAELEARISDVTVKIQGNYTVHFYNHTEGAYWKADGTIMGRVNYDAGDATQVFNFAPQDDGRYMITCDAATDKYIVNQRVGINWRGTVNMSSTFSHYHNLVYYAPGLYRIYADGDDFGYNFGGSQVTTYWSNPTNNDLFVLEPVGMPVVPAAADGKYWATMYLPYAVTIPSDVTVYAASLNEAEHKVVLTPVTGHLPANTGVVVCAESAAQVDFKKYDGTLTTAENAVASDLTGNICDKAVAAADKESIRILTLSGGKLGFYKMNSANNKLMGYKAHLELSSSAPASLDIAIGEPTAVNAVKTVEAASTVYDMQGRMVENPSRGIYVRDGKKVYVK